MLFDAAKEQGIDLQDSYLVGDRWRDVEASQNAGCSAFFIDYGYDERKPDGCYVTVNSLSEAVEKILNTKPSKGLGQSKVVRGEN